MIEKEAHTRIGTLHSDNGGEYTSDDFKHYLSQNGIKHQALDN